MGSLDEPPPLGQGSAEHLLHVEICHCSGHAKDIDDGVDMGKLMKMDLFLGHTVDLRFGIDEHLEDAPRVGLYAVFHPEALYHILHLSDREVGAALSDAEVSPLNRALPFFLGCHGG